MRYEVKASDYQGFPFLGPSWVPEVGGSPLHRAARGQVGATFRALARQEAQIKR